MKIFIVFIFSIFFIGCSSNKNIELNSYPSWYLNPIISDDSYLYGTGEDYTLEAAKNSALASIASSLSTTINSTFSKIESSNTLNEVETVNSSIINQINADSADIEFTHFKILKNETASNKFVVLVQVSRYKLFTFYKNKLDSLFDSIYNDLKDVNKKDPLTKASIYSRNLDLVPNITSLITISKSINNHFNTKPYFDKIISLQTSMNKAISKVKVSISADSNSTFFINTIKEALNDIDISIVDSNKANSFVHIKNNFLNDELFGFKISKANLTLSYSNLNKNIISTNNISISGKSRYNHLKAKENCAIVLRKKIHQDDIFYILGLKR